MYESAYKEIRQKGYKGKRSMVACFVAGWRAPGKSTRCQINRLKMIKRQMYGRAGFSLLRARVLPYTPVFPFGSRSVRILGRNAT
jgi:hypothetical protein